MHLALFDFDGTLTTRDSFLPFLHHLAGTPGFAAGLARSSGPLLAYALRLMANDAAKAQVVRQFMGGRSLAEVHEQGARYAREGLPRLLRPQTMAALATHREAGHTCVLVSASLDVYLHPWAEQQGFDAVLCTSLAVDASQRITGELHPRNCHGPEKVSRIHQWLAGRTPTHITAYGDSRGDREMLAMAQSPHWIG